MMKKNLMGLLLTLAAMIAVSTVPFWFSEIAMKDICGILPAITFKGTVTFAVIVSCIGIGIKKRSSWVVMTGIAAGIFVYSGPNVSLAF